MISLAHKIACPKLETSQPACKVSPFQLQRRRYATYRRSRW